MFSAYIITVPLIKSDRRCRGSVDERERVKGEKVERGLEIILRINIESKKTSEDCSSAYLPGSRKEYATVLNQVLPGEVP